MEPNREELEHLLARGRLSGARRERIFDDVYARTSPRRPFWQRLAFTTLAPAVAVACIAVWATRRAPPHDGFRARGAASVGPSVEVGCSDGAHDRCPAGGVLVFRVAEMAQPGYLAAWLEPKDGGERTWFTPTRHAPAVALQASVAPQLVADGYRLGVTPGTYLVRARVLRDPPDQQRALAAHGDDVLAEVTFPLEVTP